MAREMNVVPYDPMWPMLFEKEKAGILGVLGLLITEIHHFGSTSVVGMSAKPTIDVLAVVNEIGAVDAYNDEMAAMGYMARGENGIPGRRYFVRFKEDKENHASHVHIYEKGSPHIMDELLFRDFLSVDQEAFYAYKSIKIKASQQYRMQPQAYQDAKSQCVAEIMKKARIVEK